MAEQGESSQAQQQPEVGQGLELQSDAQIERTLEEAYEANNQPLIRACERLLISRLRHQRHSMHAKVQQISNLQQRLENMEIRLKESIPRYEAARASVLASEQPQQQGQQPTSYPVTLSDSPQHQHHQQHAFQPTLSIKIDQPAKFDGSSAHLSNFRFTVQQYCDTMGLHDAVRRQQFASQLLTGRALTWWRTTCERQAQDCNCHAVWGDDEFFEALEAAFRDVDHADRLRRKLSACRQLNSVQQYVTVFRSILLELGSAAPDDDTCLFQFIAGLKREVQLQVRIQRPTTLSDAELIAESVDSALYATTTRDASIPRGFKGKPNKQKQQSSYGYPSGYSGPWPMDLDYMKQQMQGKLKGKQQQQQKGATIAKDGSQLKGPHKNVQCYKCGYFGHYSRDCRVRVPRANTTQQFETGPLPPPPPVGPNQSPPPKNH